MVGAAALLIAGLAAGVHAQDRPGHPGPGAMGRGGPGGGPGGPGGPMGPGLPLAELGLTDSQQAQVRDVMERHRAELRDAAEGMRSAREAQRAAIEALPLNEDLVRSTSGAIGSVETALALAQARVHSEVFALLTPEQQATAQQIRADREGKMHQRQQQIQDRMQQRQKRRG